MVCFLGTLAGHSLESPGVFQALTVGLSQRKFVGWMGEVTQMKDNAWKFLRVSSTLPVANSP